MEVELFAQKAPRTVANFLTYVRDRFYDGLIFDRVLEDFVIQGGSVTPDLEERRTRSPIALEWGGVRNERGTIAMAHRHLSPDSATSGFFINVRDNLRLDRVSGGGYVAFGKVRDGMNVVDRIAAVRTHSRDGRVDVPREPVLIRNVHLVRLWF